MSRAWKRFCSHRTEVAGLPIYLVLTRADHQQGDRRHRRVGAKNRGRQRKVDKKYQDCEASSLPDRTLRADVHVWATSVKRPALADRPAKSQEPYGVAELFRQCLQAAQDFHDLRQKSRSRLQLILLGFMLVIAVMLSAAGIFFVTRPNEEVTRLENTIQDILPGSKGSPAERLKEPVDKAASKVDGHHARHCFQEAFARAAKGSHRCQG